jgi:hypothetical protein
MPRGDRLGKMYRGFDLMLYSGPGGGKFFLRYSSDRQRVSCHSPFSYLKHPFCRGGVLTFAPTPGMLNCGLSVTTADALRVPARPLSCWAWSLSNCVTQTWSCGPAIRHIAWLAFPAAILLAGFFGISILICYRVACFSGDTNVVASECLSPDITFSAGIGLGKSLVVECKQSTKS